MKILSICRSSIGYNRGTPLRIRNILINLLKQKGISLTVYSADKEKLPVFEKHLKLSSNFFINLITIYKDIKSNDIDIVIGHTITSYHYLLPLKFFTKARVVLEMHGFIEEEAYLCGEIGYLRYLKSKLLYTIVYRCFDLITTSSITATEILSQYNKNTVTVFGGADLNLFNPNVLPGGYFKKENNDIIIGYAGNARQWQGLPFLLEVFSDLRKENKNFRLVVLTSEVNLLPNQSGLLFFNEIEYSLVPEFLSNCDILVIPRPNTIVNKISFPSKLVEYMAMGKVVVSSRTSDAQYIITHGVDGLLYEPDNKEDLKNQILTLVDPLKRKLLGRNAYKKVKNNLTWEKQVNIVLDKLRELKSSIH